MSVTINGVTYEGDNIVVRNNKVFINGKDIEAVPNKKGILGIEVTGTLASLETDSSVNCDDIAGNVRAAGSVNCDDIGGDVSAGGSVNADDIGGSVTAGGSVVYG